MCWAKSYKPVNRSKSKMATQEEHVVPMKVDKETKGAIRYAPVDDESEIGSIYIRKTLLGSPHPETIEVQVTWSS